MLLQLYRKRCSTKLSEFSLKDLLDDLANDGYVGTLNEMRKKIAELFKAPMKTALARTSGMCGDLFFAEDGKLYYLKATVKTGEVVLSDDVFADPGDSAAISELEMEAGLIATMGEADGSELDAFCESLATILEIKFDASELKWKAVKEGKREASPVDGKAASTPTESEIELAAVLRDGKLEPLFAALKEKNGELILDQWLEGREDAEEIEYFIDKLFEADLFDEEVIVFSPDTNQPVFRANDRAALEALKNAGIRDVNGHPINVDNVKRLIKLDKTKEDKLSLSWLARIFLIDLLFKAGLSNKDISVVEGAEGIDTMLAHYDGEAVLFAISDGDLDAEAFAKLTDLIKKIGKPQVVAITRGEVDPDGAQAAGAASCLIINSLDELNAKLLQVFSANRMKLIQQAMDDFNHMISLNVVGMSLARLQGEA